MSYQHLKEAAAAARTFEKSHGVQTRLEFDDRGIIVTTRRDQQEIKREVTWTEMDHANLNMLLATVSLCANKFPKRAA